MNFLLVNFQVTATNEKFHVLVFLIDKTENVGETIWDDTSQLGICWHTQHGMSLTAACLAVSEDSTVVALDDGLDKWKRTLIINGLLHGVSIVN